MSRIWLRIVAVGLLSFVGLQVIADGLDNARAPVPVVGEPGGGEIAAGDEVIWLDQIDSGNVRELDWDALIPDDWRPEALLGDPDVASLSDSDPRAQQALDRLKSLWKKAPVVPTLDGQRVKLPGFIVPLEMDFGKINQFLLVPYFGACIHVPPPPANQTVHVVTRTGAGFEGQVFDVVWVTGTMRVEHTSSDLAEAGYRLENAEVVPYAQ